jgi:hypothetical protein
MSRKRNFRSAMTVEMARSLDAALQHEFAPGYLAALCEGSLTTEPPGLRKGHKPTGKVQTMRDLRRQRERWKRERAARSGGAA